MGGQAFASLTHPLHTPRMPLAVYEQILSTCHTILRQQYTQVASPIEAPEKPLYGDVDVLVAGPLNASFDRSATSTTEVAENLAKSLQAKAWIGINGNPTINLAVPWPSSPAEVGEVKEEDESEGVSDGEKYVQVDVHICPSETVFRWELFHAAHGDLWNILGTTIRNFGLTANNHGLYLRIPEIELRDRKKSMIFLTDEPRKVLLFLGLDEERWWKRFGRVTEMFEYAAGCRMFSVTEVLGDNGQGAAKGLVEGREEGKKNLKHNDRQRMSKRPIFKQWVEDFIPKCREEGKYQEAKTSREEVREDAFQAFGVKDEYEQRLTDWRLTTHKDELWRDVIKGCVPVEGVDPPFRAAAIRVLKAIIMDGELYNGVAPEAALTDDDGFYQVDVVRGFVKDNWKMAGNIGWARLQPKLEEKMKLKAEKRKQGERKVGRVAEQQGC